MLVEFDDVYELNTKYDKFDFTKKINQPIVIESLCKLWKFEPANVERTRFHICENSQPGPRPIVVCICSDCTHIIMLNDEDFVMMKYGEFIFDDLYYLHLKGNYLNLSTGEITMRPDMLWISLEGSLLIEATTFEMTVDDLVERHDYKRFETHQTYVEFLLTDYSVINYDYMTKSKLKNPNPMNCHTRLSNSNPSRYQLVYDPNKKCIRAYSQLNNENKHLLVRQIKKQILYLYWLLNQRLKSGRKIKDYLSKALLNNCMLSMLIQHGD